MVNPISGQSIRSHVRFGEGSSQGGDSNDRALVPVTQPGGQTPPAGNGFVARFARLAQELLRMVEDAQRPHPLAGTDMHADHEALRQHLQDRAAQGGSGASPDEDNVVDADP